MIPIHTATANFYFDQTFNDKSLDILVYLTHKELCKQLHWTYHPLQKGSFGYDTIAESIGKLLTTPNINSIEEGASIVHDAWSNCYKWWVNIKPWVELDEFYHEPTKKLGDNRRNKLASQKFKYLSEKDKESNIIISKFILVDLFNLIKIKNNHPDDTFID